MIRAEHRMLAVLMEYRKQDTTETFQILDEENIKEAFLQWIYNEKKVLWFRNDDEDFYGELCSASEEYIDIAEIDYTTGKRNGHIVFRTSRLDYFGTDMAEPYIWAMA